MTAELETLVVAAYVFATSLSIPRPGPPGRITDQELITLAVAQAVTGLSSDRQFLGMVARLLPGWFSHLPEQTQFNRRLRRLTPQITTVQLMIAELIAEGEVRLVDGTLISCANYPGCAKRSDFAPEAAYGYCPSKSQFVWGMRLVVICDRKGVPVGYDLAGPKTGQERESAFRLASAHPHSLLFADGGFWGAEYGRTMELIDIQLVTPNKHKLGQRPPSEIAKARIRLIIESVFSNLKRQMRLETHLAKTPGGLAQRIAQRLLALTLGIYLNVSTGRPPRALAAYDGR
ncbi:MAG TPA: IS982 family transposase [Burkholderiaceae bacterium]